MKEWTDPFNSFNSMKGLLYRKWMESIIEGVFLPPVEASVDPAFTCNLDCVWCNSKYICKDDNAALKIMPEEHLIKLCLFLAHWGVKGVCFAGGGEPFINTHLSKVTKMLGEMGVDTAFLTNGTLITKEDVETIVRYSRWIGISIDTSNRESYAQLKNAKEELFDKAIEALERLVHLKKKTGSSLEISYKYLIYPDNANHIYEAALLAKKIGVDYIHIRPTAGENILGGCDFHLDFPVEVIKDQLKEAFELEDENFKVFGVRHKFSTTLNLKRNFNRCLAPPLLINCGADGNVYLCVDHRGKEAFSLGTHYPEPENILTFWGGENHQSLMKCVNIDQCPRCTFGIYNEIMEKVIIKDNMCKNFP